MPKQYVHIVEPGAHGARLAKVAAESKPEHGERIGCGRGGHAVDGKGEREQEIKVEVAVAATGRVSYSSRHFSSVC